MDKHSTATLNVWEFNYFKIIKVDRTERNKNICNANFRLQLALLNQYIMQTENK